MFKYHIFGLNICSDQPLPALEASFDTPDITIKKGPVPERLVNQATFLDYFKFNHEKVVFTQAGVGTFLVEGGKAVTYKAYESDISGLLTSYLLGTVMALVMFQRGEFPLHGGLVGINNHGLAILGHSGAGKSSLVSALVKSGAGLLSDDVIRYILNEGKLLAYPSYPSQKLWYNTHTSENTQANRGTPLAVRIDKYQVTKTESFISKPLPLKAMVVLRTADQDGVSLERLNTQGALAALLDQSFRKELIKPFNLSGYHFKNVARFVKEVPVYALTRPMQGDTLNEQIQALKKVW